MVLDEPALREFYEHVYPVDLITRWLSYNLTPSTGTPFGPSQPRRSYGLTVAVGSSSANTTPFSPSKRLKLEEDEDVLNDKNAPAALSRRTDLLEETKADSQRSETRKIARQADSRSGGTELVSAGDGYLARREFCFTLLGDIFTRFRSYSSASDLRSELMRCFPEKIDVGAVYNVRPNMKQGIGTIVPMERELVFDIDMSDYDNVRSCCTGKVVCRYCWAWMSCAARVLRTVLMEDYGFRYILPVFSGRRGVHLWICDRRARRMYDDERAALVGYLTVVAPKTLRSQLVTDLALHRPIHPTIHHVLTECVDSCFTELFLTSGADNPNNITHHAEAAAVVYRAIVTVLKAGRRDVLTRFVQQVNYAEEKTLDWGVVCHALGQPHEVTDVLHAVELLLLYPRLDENVTTRRDHLLKLPFCVHPGTSSLCCPLEWSSMSTFDPQTDAPKLSDILLERQIDARWLAPLQNMLDAMSRDPDEVE